MTDQRHLERLITDLYDKADSQVWDSFIDMLDQAVWERRYSGRTLKSIDIEEMIQSVLEDHSNVPVRESASDRADEDIEYYLQLIDEITTELVCEELW